MACAATSNARTSTIFTTVDSPRMLLSRKKMSRATIPISRMSARPNCRKPNMPSAFVMTGQSYEKNRHSGETACHSEHRRGISTRFGTRSLITFPESTLYKTAGAEPHFPRAGLAPANSQLFDIQFIPNISVPNRLCMLVFRDGGEASAFSELFLSFLDKNGQAPSWLGWLITPQTGRTASGTPETGPIGRLLAGLCKRPFRSLPCRSSLTQHVRKMPGQIVRENGQRAGSSQVGFGCPLVFHKEFVTLKV